MKLKTVHVLLLVVGFLMGIAATTAFTRGVTKGDSAIVPEWKWVDARNSSPVKSGNDTYSYGDTCGIERGGKLTVVGVAGDILLVSYSTDAPRGGTSCLPGVNFLISEKEFSAMTTIYLATKGAEDKEKLLVQSLSSQ